MSARPGHAPIATAAPIDEARLRDLREMRAEHPDVADILVDPTLRWLDQLGRTMT